MCGATPSTPAPAWINQGPAELRRQQQAAVAEQKTGVDGKKLQVVRPVQEEGRELRNWWVEEMLATDQPLTERMVLFWHNHFTSSFLKVRYPAALFRQNALFRREALGNFATLLKDVARDPAMLIYLDGMRSVARQPNENFARELLGALHPGRGPLQRGRHQGRRARLHRLDRRPRDRRVPAAATHEHDDGEKTFLGQTGRFGGERDHRHPAAPPAHRRDHRREAVARVRVVEARSPAR